MCNILCHPNGDMSGANLPGKFWTAFENDYKADKQNKVERILKIRYMEFEMYSGQNKV